MKIGPLDINLRHVSVFIIIGVALILVMNFSERLEELSRLQHEAELVQVKATAVMLTQHALETRVALATSPAAAEEYARQQAHMAQPGDQVFAILPEPGATAPATPTPTPFVSDRTNLNEWVDFIFGK